ncbi:WecB/TagA/CpsF family glycosyltransferase [Spirosoma fluviale]|nr:WecB/TagA/CpsF family glycosyltransferase [Spirosoma fluviale]
MTQRFTSTEQTNACPKQERWMKQMRGRMLAVMVGVGGALPIFTGTQGRSPNSLLVTRFTSQILFWD